MKKNKFFSLVIALSLGTSGIALAQTFPSAPVKIVVPYPAGGSLDVMVRVLAKELQAKWAQPVVVDNRPGASEAIGAMAVSNAAADGYTLLAASQSALTLNPLLQKKLAYNPTTDLVPVSRMVDVPMVFVVPASSPARNLDAFVKLARQHSTDKGLTYGSTGLGGPIHLSMATFAKDNNLKMVHVPYKGSAELMQGMAGDQVDSSVVAATSAAAMVRSQKVVAIAVSSPTRLKSLPTVPTVAETGIKDMEARFFIGLLAPKGTPAKTVDFISASVREVIYDESFKSKNLDPNGMLAVASTPGEFRDYIERDRSSQAARIKTSGLEME